MALKDPSVGGDRLDYDELNGALLLFFPHEIIAEIVTAYGPTTAVRADLAVLDGEHKGRTYTDTLVFPKVLQSALRSSIGDEVLGRLCKGNPKPGQSAPWKLEIPTEAEKITGHKYLAHVAAQAVADEKPF